MNPIIVIFVAMATSAVAVCGANDASNAQTTEVKSVEGAWYGKIEASGLELRAKLTVKKNGANSYTGTFQSIDQGAQVLPLDVVTVKNNSLHFELKIAHASWDGTLSDSGAELTGSWMQSGTTIPLNFSRTDNSAPILRPQEPKRPYPYREEEVLYNNQPAGTRIGGTLTMPNSKGPFPAVLLITGSGQQDRNEALLGHKPFLIISDYLTRRGIAVLRVDDRGIGTSNGDFAKSTTADFATDVEAGISFLKSRKDINHGKIGLIGHSEGGVIAPMVAARSKGVAFIVMLAGTGVTGGKILTAQGELIAKAAGASDEVLKFNSHFQERLFAVLAAEKDPAKAEPLLQAAIADEIKNLTEEQKKTVLAQSAGAAETFNSPWMRYFIAYDPVPALRMVKCPALAMNGEKDMQVPPKLNLPAIAAALKAGGNKDYTIKLMPGMNHLFQTCKTGAPSEYAGIEETMSPVALKTMGDWIVARTK